MFSFTIVRAVHSTLISLVVRFYLLCTCVLSLLKIGVRCDSAFISVYDASGTEVENAELLFCEEGTHVCQASIVQWRVNSSSCLYIYTHVTPCPVW